VHVLKLRGTGARAGEDAAPRPTLQVSLQGVYSLKQELERNLYLLVAPVVKILTGLMLRTELPKFLKGFLVQVPVSER